MATDFKLPDLGENITGGDIVQVLVAEGDTIQPQQAVVEIETDKAVLEVPCPIGGRVVKVHVKAGQRADVGAPLMTIEGDGQAADKKAPAAAAAAPKVEPEAGEPKPKPPAPRKPPAREPAKSAPAEAKPLDEEPPASRQPAAALPLTAAPRAAGGEPVAAGPSTRRLARELGVDLDVVAAAHSGGRLTEADVKEFVRQEMTRPRDEGGPLIQEPPLPDFSQWGPVERVQMSSLNRKSAEHVHLAWALAPHVTQFDLADITTLESLRKRYRQHGPATNIKLTAVAFVLKAVATALKEQPYVNASVDMQSGEVILKRYYNIGVAVDTDAGLIVPVIRNVDQKRVLDLAVELEETADRTRRRKIKIEELQGGTFTITNLGGIGGTGFTPIINHPEVAILGVARSREEPVVENGQLGTRRMLPLCLSYDHRVINGADGARFLRKVASLLEDPEMLLLQS